jgi:hypothetical protein
LIPQVLVDRYYGSEIPGVGYLVVSAPALLLATVCFLIRRFIQRLRNKDACTRA